MHFLNFAKIKRYSLIQLILTGEALLLTIIRCSGELVRKEQNGTVKIEKLWKLKNFRDWVKKHLFSPPGIAE